MGTKSDSDQTKVLLLEAAGELFAELGYSGVTARQVVAKAGVSLGAIPYHFGSMESLYREALIEACKSARDVGQLAEEAEQIDSQAALKLAVAWALEEYSAPEVSWQVKLVEREFLNPSEAFREVIRLKVRPDWEGLCRILARAVDRPADSDAVAFGVITMHTLASTFLTHRRLIQELAPTLIQKTEQLEKMASVLAGLTVDAVSGYVAQFEDEKRKPSARGARPAKPARPRTDRRKTP